MPGGKDFRHALEESLGPGLVDDGVVADYHVPLDPGRGALHQFFYVFFREYVALRPVCLPEKGQHPPVFFLDEGLERVAVEELFPVDGFDVFDFPVDIEQGYEQQCQQRGIAEKNLQARKPGRGRGHGQGSLDFVAADAQCFHDGVAQDGVPDACGQGFGRGAHVEKGDFLFRRAGREGGIEGLGFGRIQRVGHDPYALHFFRCGHEAERFVQEFVQAAHALRLESMDGNFPDHAAESIVAQLAFEIAGAGVGELCRHFVMQEEGLH